MMSVNQKAEVKGAIYSVYVNQIIVEGRICPVHRRRAEVYYIGSEPHVKACCQAFEQEIIDLIHFGR